MRYSYEPVQLGGCYAAAMRAYWLAVVLALMFSAPAQAASGGLDPTFDRDGTRTVSFGQVDYGHDVLPQRDGNLVLFGLSINYHRNPPGADYRFALARLRPNGALDPTFDRDGRVTTDPTEEDDFAVNAVLDARGGIVALGAVVGKRSGDSLGHVLVRYRADGSIDKTLGHDGRVRGAFPGNQSYADDLAVQRDGKILVLGSTGPQIGLARYNADGSPDPTFGVRGMALTAVGTEPDMDALALQPDGKIVAVGSTNTPTGPAVVLLRYKPDGSPDPSFGTGGLVLTPTSYDLQFDPIDLLVQRDGKITIAGAYFTATNTSLTSDVALLRYTADGKPDRGFGQSGMVLTHLDDYDAALSIAQQADGKLVAAGFAADLRPGGGGPTNMALLRYKPNGALDTSFDRDGKVITRFRGNSEAFGVALQGGGTTQQAGSASKIVVAGHTGDDMSADFAVARYNQ